MATPEEIRETANTALQPVWVALRTHQANVRSSRGRYRQFGRTHIVAPLDGLTVLPDNLAFRPGGETVGWTGLGALPCCIWCDVYNGPQGDGYAATAEVRLTIGGRTQTFQRCLNEGPEEFRQFNWTRVTKPDGREPDED